MPVPTLTQEQRIAALKKAKEARQKRVEASKMLASGELSIEALLNTEDESLKRMTIEKVLRSFEGIGKAKVSSIMDSLDIASNRRVGGLGNRQKEVLIKYVNETILKK